MYMYYNTHVHVQYCMYIVCWLSILCEITLRSTLFFPLPPLPFFSPLLPPSPSPVLLFSPLSLPISHPLFYYIRSRGCYIIQHKASSTVYVWMGSKASESLRGVAGLGARNLKRR